MWAFIYALVVIESTQVQEECIQQVHFAYTPPGMQVQMQGSDTKTYFFLSILWYRLKHEHAEKMLLCNHNDLANFSGGKLWHPSELSETVAASLMSFGTL